MSWRVVIGIWSLALTSVFVASRDPGVRSMLSPVWIPLEDAPTLDSSPVVQPDQEWFIEKDALRRLGMKRALKLRAAAAAWVSGEHDQYISTRGRGALFIGSQPMVLNSSGVPSSWRVSLEVLVSGVEFKPGVRSEFLAAL